MDQSCDKQVSNNSFTGDFSPSNVYSTGSGASHVTAFSFDESTLSTILQKGIVIQGHGIRLTKVSISDPAGITGLTVTPASSQVYTLDGRKVYHIQPVQVYIKNGKKQAIKP